MTTDFNFKYAIVGADGVGKTSILLRYCDDTFTSNFIPSLGIDFYDLAESQWKRTHDSFVSTLKSAKGIIIAFDLTDPVTFNDVQKRWWTEVQDHADPKAPRILVGTKTDLTVERKVERADAQQFADDNGLRYFEVSAKQNINIETVFERLSEDAIKVHQPAAGGAGGAKAPAAGPKKTGRFALHIHAGEGLAARDKNGKSDPFCVVKMINKDGKEDKDSHWETPVKKATLDPVWDAKHDYGGFDSNWDKLLIQVFDKDLIGSDSLGEVEIPVSDIKTHEAENQQWQSLNIVKQKGDKKDVSGKILIHSLKFK